MTKSKLMSLDHSLLQIKRMHIEYVAAILGWVCLVFIFPSDQFVSFCYLLGTCSAVIMVLALGLLVAALTSARSNLFFTLHCYLLHFVAIGIVIHLVSRRVEPYLVFLYLTGFCQGLLLLSLKVWFSSEPSMTNRDGEFDSESKIR